MQIPGFYSQKIFEQKGKMGNFFACTGQERDRFLQPGNDRFWCYRLANTLASKYRPQQTIQRTLDVIIIYHIIYLPQHAQGGSVEIDFCGKYKYFIISSRFWYFYPEPVVLRNNLPLYYIFFLLSRICIIPFLVSIKFLVYSQNSRIIPVFLPSYSHMMPSFKNSYIITGRWQP